MGAIRASRNKSILAGETTNAQSRRKHKGKYRMKTKFKPKEEFDPSDGASRYKKDKHKRFKKGKCSYYKKGTHIEKGCMKNTIEQMSILLKQHNISVSQDARKADSGDKTEDHKRCHAMKAGFSKSHAFPIDSGASNHMVASKELFISSY